MRQKPRTALVTLSIGRATNSIGRLSHPLMQKYADKIGSAFIVIDKKRVGNVYSKFEKFQIYDLLKQYDRVCYLDSDIFVMPDCPNIFERVPVEAVGAFFDSEVKGNSADIPEWRDDEIRYFQEEYGDIGWSRLYFNTGVFVVSAGHREMFDYTAGVHRGFRFIDQTQLNYNLVKLKYKTFDLGPSYNYLVALSGSKEQFDRRFQHHILHYAGFKQFYENESLYRRMQADLKHILKGASLPGVAA